MITLLSETLLSLVLYIKLSIFDFTFTQKIENFSQKIGGKRILRFSELNFGRFFSFSTCP